MLNHCIDQAVGVPEQGKKAARMMGSIYKTGFGFYKKIIVYASGNGASFQENPSKSG